MHDVCIYTLIRFEIVCRPLTKNCFHPWDIKRREPVWFNFVILVCYAFFLTDKEIVMAQYYLRRRSWSRGKSRSRGELILRDNTWGCWREYGWGDRVRWRYRLGLRQGYWQGVAWLVSSRGVVRRLRGHPIHHLRLSKAWRKKGRETNHVRLHIWPEISKQMAEGKRAVNYLPVTWRQPAAAYLVVMASLCSFDWGSENTPHVPREREHLYSMFHGGSITGNKNWKL